MNAYISVDNKEGVAEFADGFLELDPANQIWATLGTAHHIAKETGRSVGTTQELLVRLGLEHGNPNREAQAADLAKHFGTGRQALQGFGIDLVYIGLKEPAKPGEVIDRERGAAVIDKGGVAMLTYAIGGGCLTLSHPDQLPGMLNWLEAGQPDRAQMLTQLHGEATMAISEHTSATGLAIMQYGK